MNPVSARCGKARMSFAGQFGVTRTVETSRQRKLRDQKKGTGLKTGYCRKRRLERENEFRAWWILVF
jgi:hypothetical protein